MTYTLHIFGRNESEIATKRRYAYCPTALLAGKECPESFLLADYDCLASISLPSYDADIDIDADPDPLFAVIAVYSQGDSYEYVSGKIEFLDIVFSRTAAVRIANKVDSLLRGTSQDVPLPKGLLPEGSALNDHGVSISRIEVVAFFPVLSDDLDEDRFPKRKR